MSTGQSMILGHQGIIRVSDDDNGLGKLEHLTMDVSFIVGFNGDHRTVNPIIGRKPTTHQHEIEKLTASEITWGLYKTVYVLHNKKSKLAHTFTHFLHTFLLL